MTKRIIAAFMVATALVFSALVPASFAAESTAVSHFVLKKGDSLYSIDIQTYNNMKAVGLHNTGQLSGSSIAYLQTSDTFYYERNAYSNAKAALSNASVSETIAFLIERDFAQSNLNVGAVQVGNGGSIVLQPGSGGVTPDPEPSEDFEVIGIE